MKGTLFYLPFVTYRSCTTNLRLVVGFLGLDYTRRRRWNQNDEGGGSFGPVVVVHLSSKEDREHKQPRWLGDGNQSRKGKHLWCGIDFTKGEGRSSDASLVCRS